MNKKYTKKLLTRLTSMVLMGFIVLSCLAGCGKSKEENEKLNIVTVIYPQYDFARAIAKDYADITMIMKPGAEIHGFEPSLSDIEAIANADVFIYNGGESDTWIENIFDSLDTEDILIVNMMDHAKLLEEENINGEAHVHSHSHSEHGINHDECDSRAGIDEHIWTSPKNAVLMVEAVCDAICTADPQNEKTYQENAADYIALIEGIDKELESVRKSAKIDTVAVGDRFPYLYMAKEYDLKYMAAFPGCSSETDANPSVIINIIEQMKQKGIDAVLCTELSDKRMAKTISEETEAKILTLHSCQSISAQDFENGMRYVDLMKQNVITLKEALG